MSSDISDLFLELGTAYTLNTFFASARAMEIGIKQSIKWFEVSNHIVRKGDLLLFNTFHDSVFYHPRKEDRRSKTRDTNRRSQTSVIEKNERFGVFTNQKGYPMLMDLGTKVESMDSEISGEVVCVDSPLSYDSTRDIYHLTSDYSVPPTQRFEGSVPGIIGIKDGNKFYRPKKDQLFRVIAA